MGAWPACNLQMYVMYLKMFKRLRDDYLVDRQGGLLPLLSEGTARHVSC